MISFRREYAMNSLALGTRDGGLKKSLMGPQPSPLCSGHTSGIYLFLKKFFFEDAILIFSVLFVYLI